MAAAFPAAGDTEESRTMRRLATSLLAIAVAIGASQPAAAFPKIEIKPPRIELPKIQPKKIVADVKETAKDVGRDIRDTGEKVVDTAKVVAPIVEEEARDLAESAVGTVRDGAVNAVEGARELGRDAIDVGEFVIENPGETLEIVKTAAVETWDDVKTTAEIIINSSPEEKKAAARAAYEEVKPFLPMLSGLTMAVEQSGDKDAIIDAIKAGDAKEAARLIALTGGMTDERLTAAKAAGFETLTVGVGLDVSLGVGAVFEGGVAIDIDQYLNDTPENGATIYGTYGLTAGASAGGDGTLGAGLWRAETDAIHGDGWGMVVAGTGGGGASGGMWFTPDRANAGSVGSLAGFTAGGSVGLSVELGELNYVRTRTQHG